MQAGAQMVKLEGGEWLAETVRFLVERSIPVCAHVGLTPQSVHAFGGFKVQGKTEAAASQVLRDARAVQDAGAQLIVIEAIPTLLGAEVTKQLRIPTIGIGAGAGCDGQVQVWHDALGLFETSPRHAKRYAEIGAAMESAIRAYAADVEAGAFPTDAQSARMDAEELARALA
jgi:3-methyl-2-oxobutanoate hydroxymethyltransferase